MSFEKMKAKLARKMFEFTDYWHVRGLKALPHIAETVNFGSNVLVKPEVHIGGKTFVNGPATMIDSGTIGAFCSIADHVVIGPGEHPLDAVTTHLEWPIKAFGKPWENPKAPPIIGNDVWIGSGACILRGSVIEDGAVIAAGAVVRGHVPAYAIVGGVPARILRYRFDEETRERLQRTKWWGWDEERLHEACQYFGDPERFLEFAAQSGGMQEPGISGIRDDVSYPSV